MSKFSDEWEKHCPECGKAYVETLSRDTAIKLVEAAEYALPNVEILQPYEDLKEAIKAARRELGI